MSLPASPSLWQFPVQVPSSPWPVYRILPLHRLAGWPAEAVILCRVARFGLLEAPKKFGLFF